MTRTRTRVASSTWIPGPMNEANVIRPASRNHKDAPSCSDVPRRSKGERNRAEPSSITTEEFNRVDRNPAERIPLANVSHLYREVRGSRIFVRIIRRAILAISSDRFVVKREKMMEESKGGISVGVKLLWRT